MAETMQIAQTVGELKNILEEFPDHMGILIQDPKSTLEKDIYRTLEIVDETSWLRAVVITMGDEVENLP